ncbi:MAG: cytosine permease [Peptococcaceae bacterium]|nr:cytosine permease [Peptococcaceae bacterium]
MSKEYRVEEQVPMDDRHFSFFDMLATWIGANANPGTWYVGGVVAALGFWMATTNILIANPIAYIIMAFVAYMGYKVGTTTMGLLRVPFGITGSKIPSVMNVFQFVGWTAANTFIAAISMSFLLSAIFGWPAYGQPGAMGNMIFCITFISVLQVVLTVVGGSRSIKYFERFAVTLLIFLTIWETVAILGTYSLKDIVAWRPPQGVTMQFGSAMDIMAAFSLGWVALVADFTRYTKNKKGAVVAPMIGANIALFWFAMVGVLGVIATSISTGTFDPNKSDPSSIAAALGLGWVAFGVLILSTVTTNVVDIYASGMSLTNVFPKLKPFTSLFIVALLCVVVAYIPLVVGSFLGFFILFLDYIGFVFAPILSIMIVDYYIIHKGHYDWSQASKVNGPYWFTNGFNWKTIGVWVASCIAFLIFKQTSFIMNTSGAIFAVVAFSAVLYWLVARGTAGVSPKAEESISGA